jgi:hypothetical protein
MVHLRAERPCRRVVGSAVACDTPSLREDGQQGVEPGGDHGGAAGWLRPPGEHDEDLEVEPVGEVGECRKAGGGEADQNGREALDWHGGRSGRDRSPCDGPSVRPELLLQVGEERGQVVDALGGADEVVVGSLEDDLAAVEVEEPCEGTLDVDKAGRGCRIGAVGNDPEELAGERGEEGEVLRVEGPEGIPARRDGVPTPDDVVGASPMAVPPDAAPGKASPAPGAPRRAMAPAPWPGTR